VGLKHEVPDGRLRDGDVSDVPLWGWSHSSLCGNSSIKRFQTYPCGVEAMSAPLTSMPAPMVSDAPLWGWSIGIVTWLITTYGFRRTLVRLKPQAQPGARRPVRVSDEPLWGRSCASSRLWSSASAFQTRPSGVEAPSSSVWAPRPRRFQTYPGGVEAAGHWTTECGTGSSRRTLAGLKPVVSCPPVDILRFRRSLVGLKQPSSA